MEHDLFDDFMLADENEGIQVSEEASPSPRLPFRLKLLLLAGVLSTVPLIGVGWTLIDVNSTTVKTSSREIQLAVIEDMARTIEKEFVEAQNGLEALARALTNERIDAAHREALALVLVESTEAIDHAGIYDQAGNKVDVVFEDGASVSLPERLPTSLRSRSAQQGVATGPVRLVAGRPSALVILPIPMGTVSWFVASHVSLEGIQRRVEEISDTRFGGREGAVYVVDSKLRVLAHNNVEKAMALESVAGQGILRGLDGKTFADSVALSGEYTSPSGSMVGSLRSLPIRQWAIVAQVPRAEAYASLSRMRTIIVVSIGVVMFLAFVAAVIVARRMTAPIATLVSFARDLSARRFDRRVTVATSDEISVLAAAMSSAAAELEASEKRIKREVEIRSDLGRYLPGQLVDKVVLREQSMSLGGERRNITVLFADVVGFTPLAEQHSASEVVALLNELFTMLSEVVFRHGGTLDKFIGDCVMAFWGAPTATEDHAAQALRAAEDMMRWLEVGNETWQERYGMAIRLAIGVNTGEAVVGNFGSESRMEYTAIGDAVNVAARLEAMARPQQILVTEATKRLATEEFSFHSLGDHQLAGRAQSVELHEVQL